jgi:hypothetical protein
VIPIVFHFNKAHNADPENIPPWVVKAKGETYYVHHMDIEPGVGFSTKETPDSHHTKAALKIKGRLKIIQLDNDTLEAIAY